MTFYPSENFFQSFSSFLLSLFSYELLFECLLSLLLFVCVPQESRTKWCFTLSTTIAKKVKDFKFHPFHFVIYIFCASSCSSLSMLDAIKTYGKCHYEYREERHEELTRTIWDFVLLFFLSVVIQYFHSRLCVLLSSLLCFLLPVSLFY